MDNISINGKYNNNNNSRIVSNDRNNNVLNIKIQNDLLLNKKNEHDIIQATRVNDNDVIENNFDENYVNNSNETVVNENVSDVKLEIMNNINSLSLQTMDNKCNEKWEYGTSGFMKDNLWNDPCTIFKVSNVQKLENFLNYLKYLHPDNQKNTYFARLNSIPSGEFLMKKHCNGCSYICFNFNINALNGLNMSADIFYMIIKEIILFLVSCSYDDSESSIYESIVCLESLCKVHRSDRSRNNYSLKIWKLGKHDNFTVLEYIIKIFENCRMNRSEHVKYFSTVINNMLDILKKIKNNYDKYERVLQRNKFCKMTSDEITEFKNICDDYDIFLPLVKNTLVGIKIKNYVSEKIIAN